MIIILGPRRKALPVSVNKNSFSARPCPATQKHKLLCIP